MNILLEKKILLIICGGISAYKSLREEKLKLELMRNKILGGVLILVIFVLIVFK